MRSLLIVLATLAVLAVGFWLYVRSQGELPAPYVQQQGAPPVPATLPATAATVGRLGPGEGAWYDRYDPRTRQRTMRIRWEQYEPLEDGRLRVQRPQIELLLKSDDPDDDVAAGRNIIRITGVSGHISTQETVDRARGAPPGLGAGRVPTAGDLSDVTIQLIDEGRVVLTATMNNAFFDSETYEIATRAFEDNGVLVPADQVPVTVVGDYEFEGRGLRLQYNQLERRLEYLRIHRGRRLKVLHPGSFGLGRFGASAGPLAHAPAEPGREPERRPAAGGPIPGIILAAVGRSLPRGTPVATRPAPPVVYHAVLVNDVRIYQGQRQVADAHQMELDFIPADARDNGAGAARDGAAQADAGRAADARKPSAPAPPRRAPGLRAAAAPDRASVAHRADRDVGATAESEAEVEQPIEILWDGPLTIEPLATARPSRLENGYAIVRLIGSERQSVRLDTEQETRRIALTCGRFTFWTLDGGSLLESTPQWPVELRDNLGMKIVAPRIEFAGSDAVIDGPGTGRLPLPSQPPGADDSAAADFLDLTWSQPCILAFADESDQALAIREARFTGEVSIVHPDLRMSATRSMALAFAERPRARPDAAASGTSMPPLKRLEAEGDVVCRVLGKGDADVRQIESQRLEVLTSPTADGDLYVSRIIADGNVLATGADGILRTGRLTMLPQRPTTRPAAPTAALGELIGLEGEFGVDLRSADGRFVQGTRLQMDTEGPWRWLSLRGWPARIGQHDDSIEGSLVLLTQKLRRLDGGGERIESQQWLVPGPGRIQGAQRAGGDAPRLAVITWTESMDGQDDVIMVRGNVLAESSQPDGTRTTISAAQARIVTEAPATQPATAPAAEGAAAGLSPGLLAGRSVRSIELDGGASATSRLDGDDGRLLLLRHLVADRIECHSEAAATDAANAGAARVWRLLIPVPGSMLSVDNRPSATQPATRPAEEMTGRGSLAVSWGERLLYTQSDGALSMTGGVTIVRQGADERPEQRLRITADRLLAEVRHAAGEPTSLVATPTDLVAAASLQKLTLEGRVHVVAKGMDLEAVTAVYDPVAHTLTLRGTDDQRVRSLDENGFETVSYTELVIDTRTLAVKSSRDVRVRSRK